MGNTFKDTEGREWEPRITLHALEGFGRETGLSIEQLLDWRRLKLSVITAALWHCVAKQAEKRKIQRDDFTASVGMRMVRDAIQIVLAKVEDEFPEASAEVEEEIEAIKASIGGGGESPLEDAEDKPSSSASTN